MSALRETLPFGTLQAGSVPPISALLLRAAGVVMRWELRRLTRKGLRRLDDHLLRDIGLDRWSAEAEIAKPFWRG